jgi:CheY-like chemotaxis protein
VVDLNALITNLEKMLRRLIGENIEIRTALEPDLGCVKVDPTQIEQVIMNLVVNARDAMPRGGSLVMETANVEVERGYALSHTGLRARRYVVLTVSDTGHGMDAETLQHLFEPFFTTKERGKGTGLGLSTVYGIVQQHDGEIRVHSEPGRGAAFKIYLPRVDDRASSIESAGVRAERQRGSETILLVEDEEAVRTMVRETLKQSGYTVLEAASGEEALAILHRHGAKVDLLLTDLVMPGMSGGELADVLNASDRDMKVLFMSGYADNLPANSENIDPESMFLQKPFTAAALTAKVRFVFGDRGALASPPASAQAPKRD